MINIGNRKEKTSYVSDREETQLCEFISPIISLSPRYRIVQLLQKVYLFVCDALRDLVPFVQFKKREKNL